MKILVLNCGSSSLKYMIYDWDSRRSLASGVVERVGFSGSFIKHKVPNRETYTLEQECPSHKEAIGLLVQTLTDDDTGVISSLSEIGACGHRVVHGGEKFARSVKITPDVVATFRELADLAPLHNPPNILGIEAAMDYLPEIPHVAVMDTSFHQTMPPASYIYATPYKWYEDYKVRRYGFHGTSHLYVSKRAAVMLGKKPQEVNLVTCHIGNGVSFTAIKNGESYDHSMGLTPLEGLVMGTRSGDIDPAIVGYIADKEGLTAQQVVNMLNKKSGVLGISGKYVDRRDIHKAMDEGDERAWLAFNIECHRAKKYLGAYTAVLGHTDAVVFTAGVGERGWEMREEMCKDMEELGITIDVKLNRKAVSRNHEFTISASDSPVKVFVIPTDEELVFVEDVVGILEGTYGTADFRYSFENPDYVNELREEAYKRELGEQG
ncbi:acetate/propionate family kinase [candidate division WOR-3 bacterium]|uniref:Acetate kinase n=1 Tax=candidate division WOR-3 bacterium TaxID=2052148 RepID=A0A9D5KBU9_UNCW3|nr:acetate/propionate family kinase [candidate division WOR-3 bacterium]MBD3364881.1 acetate/propionate family kinase [candidate division WOR-3 bacterium]